MHLSDNKERKLIRMRAKYVKVLHASAVGVADRWKAQYLRDDKLWVERIATSGRSCEEIYTKLRALEPKPDIDKVSEIIGNKAWSYLVCSGCNEYVTKLILFDKSFQDQKPMLCETCLREAVEILGNEAPQS